MVTLISMPVSLALQQDRSPVACKSGSCVWTNRASFPDVSKHFADLLETDTVWKEHGLESGGFAFISSASSKRPASDGKPASLLLPCTLSDERAMWERERWHTQRTRQGVWQAGKAW